jgi:transglutaminase-like putative cysteine protease
VDRDPTSLAEMAGRHVLLARGRDYADARPLFGIYSGQQTELFGVTVEITSVPLPVSTASCGSWPATW